MAKTARKKVAFVSSFLPRKCGIATFTSSLIENVALAANGDFEPLVVAMRSDKAQKYDHPVKFEIRENVKNDYICAADYINFSHVDVVSVQHEFGLFGGPAGSYLTSLLKRLNAPIITTLHTVLNEPDSAYRDALIELCSHCCKVITMNERGVDMLADIYGISGRKVELIPHGIPDLPFVDNNYYKHKFGMEGRRTILTFGLLSKNKGIEMMLKAMLAVVRAEPSALYIILGMTHPSVLKHDGESYRFSLQGMVKELQLQNHVIFHDRFVSNEELNNFLCAADIYVTPYLNEEQLTSGTLSFAVGTGRAVVSTPYWAALELLDKGQGKLVPFGDSGKLAETVVEILKNNSLFYSLRRKAYDYGRSRTWPKTGQAYWKLFNSKLLNIQAVAKTIILPAKTISPVQIPEPSLLHLKRLSDDTGLFQHGIFTTPSRKYGYTTDDNARAVIAMTKYYTQYPEQEAFSLFDKYLSFILHAQNADGTVRNIMTYDRNWQSNEPASDALGRTLWALGTVMAQPPSAAYISTIKDRFDRSVKHVQQQYPRGMAYSILGMSDYLKQFGGASEIKRELEMAADGLVDQYNENTQPDWQWFEDILTYDNAVMPHALFVAVSTLGNKKYLEVAEKTCRFLLKNTFDGNHFSFVGCKGWYERAGRKATFDQQPLEAASTILMLGAAYEATQNDEFLTLQRKAFDWFLGANDLQVCLYDFRTKGCNDGLTANGVNTNQGAESILSFLVSLLAIAESDALVDKITAADNMESDSYLLASAPEKNVSTPAYATKAVPTSTAKTKQLHKGVQS